MRVGFVGVGVMGGPMATNVLRGGYPVTVCDKDPGAVARMKKEGSSTADSPKHIAEASDVVITMLPEPSDIQAAVLGPDSILEGAWQDFRTGVSFSISAFARFCIPTASK